MIRLTIEQLENYRDTYDRYEGINFEDYEEMCNELIEYKSLEEELDYYKKLCNQFSQIINVKELKKLIKLMNENHLLKELDNPIDSKGNYGRRF